MKNNDALASDGEPGLLEAGGLGQAQALGLEAREATGSGQQGRGCLVKVPACHPVAMLRDAPVPANLAGLVPTRCQTQVSTGTGGSSEALRLIKG